MAILRAMSILPGKSNKPEDVFVNTWHFNSSGTGAIAAGVVRDHIVEFFNTPVPPATAGQEVCAYMSNVINRSAGACKIKVYDLADAKPRVPIEFSWTLGASSGGTGAELPAEVALCMSFYAGLNRPRYRGRLYIGPLHIGSTIDDTVQADRAIPHASFRLVVANALKRLILKGANTQNLAVYSAIDNEARIVTNGWVDDAWDTQRRRGQDSTSRILVP